MSLFFFFSTQPALCLWLHLVRTSWDETEPCGQPGDNTPSAHTHNHTVQSCLNLLKAGWSGTFSAKKPQSFCPGPWRGGLNAASYCSTNISTVVHCPRPLLVVHSLNMCHFSLQEGYLCAPHSNHCATQHVFSQTRDQPLSHHGKRASCLFFIRTFEWLRNTKKVLCVNEFLSLCVCLWVRCASNVQTGRRSAGMRCKTSVPSCRQTLFHLWWNQTPVFVRLCKW